MEEDEGNPFRGCSLRGCDLRGAWNPKSLLCQSWVHDVLERGVNGQDEINFVIGLQPPPLANLADLKCRLGQGRCLDWAVILFFRIRSAWTWGSRLRVCRDIGLNRTRAPCLCLPPTLPPPCFSRREKGACLYAELFCAHTFIRCLKLYTRVVLTNAVDSFVHYF